MNIIGWKLTSFPNEKAVLSLKMKDKVCFLTYRHLSAFGKKLSSEDVEEVSAVVNEQLVVGTVTGYKGQAGLIFVWDPIRDRIVHVTNGEFAVKALLYSCKVYSLHFVSSWGKEPEFVLRCENLGCRDALHDSAGMVEISDALKDCHYPADGKIGIVVNGGKLNITIGDDVKESIQINEYWKINPAFSDLFKRWKAEQEKESEESTENTYPQHEVVYSEFKDSFCPDGYTSIRGYDRQEQPNIDVLYILKEAHLEEEGEILKPEKKDCFWFNRPCREKEKDLYHRRIKETFEPLIKYCEINPVDDFTPFGYMNINKRGGAGETNMTRLQNYANHYAELISEQIKIMNPRVIVCCGCYGIVQKIINDKGNNQRLKYIVDLYHPNCSGFGKRIREFEKYRYHIGEGK